MHAPTYISLRKERKACDADDFDMSGSTPLSKEEEKREGPFGSSMCRFCWFGWWPPPAPPLLAALLVRLAPRSTLTNRAVCAGRSEGFCDVGGATTTAATASAASAEGSPVAWHASATFLAALPKPSSFTRSADAALPAIVLSHALSTSWSKRVGNAQCRRAAASTSLPH